MESSTPWNPSTEPTSLGDPAGYVMLVDGQSFVVSDRSGDMQPATPAGLYIGDLRVLSCLRLTVDDAPIEGLAVYQEDAFSALYVGRAKPRAAGVSLLVARERTIGLGLREAIRIESFSADAIVTRVAVEFNADFADLFAVKEGRAATRSREAAQAEPGRITFGWSEGEARRTTSVRTAIEGVTTTKRGFAWTIALPPKGRWEGCFDVTMSIDGEPVASRAECGQSVAASPSARRASTWRARTLRIASPSPTLNRCVQRAVNDLGALRLFDPEGDGRPVIAAGAPWFMTLFGRDAIITAWMALPVDPGLALGVLDALAKLQGREVDPTTEEEPGRILHEVRWGAAASLALGQGSAYYGTADASPLFVMLLNELVQWGGLPDEDLRRLLPHADRALQWMDDYGDRDGDGFIEYERAGVAGLRNQGWKDSWDGIRFADGTVAEPPIALSEVQAYAFGAWRARADIAQALGDAVGAARFERRASELADRFNDRFWLPRHQRFALGLDNHKTPIDAAVSNDGHCLWAGIAAPDHAKAAGSALVRSALWSGWGIRTMAADAGGYDPLSYHCGTVWPHDNAIAAAGLMRYGLVAEAHQVICAQLDAAEHFGGRLPELFAGVSRESVPVPVRFPTSCSPQAWSAASPLLHLRTLLRLEPRVPSGLVAVDPALPDMSSWLRIERLIIDGVAVRLRADASGAKVDRLPARLRLTKRAT